MRRLLPAVLVLILLAALAVVADRVAAALAERAVADQIESRLDVTGTPDVTIAGFPFLTQVVARDLGNVHVRADGAGAEGVELADVDVRAHGVGLENPPTARRLELTGTLGQADLKRLVDRATGLDLDVAPGPEGLTLGTEILGQPLTVLATPAVTDGGLKLTPARATLGGAQVDPSTVQRLLGADLLSMDVKLGPLPMGLTLAAVTPEADGVRVTLTGTDVVLQR